MLKALLDLNTDACAEAHRHAYNAAFETLELAWHWDAATYARIQAQGPGGMRAWLLSEYPHLLRAYDADFLVQAVETAKARCYAGMTGSRDIRYVPTSAEPTRLAA
ncbi:hypothetical protein [uncultured Ramlibacter sp.]|uniref:hypothetical protein n=1 Tax=uncultured Ramlibacter sp. TaxID=260755 RepID=UPI002626CB1E|nr:hypothetical protein [uncultured Ramlibacter sp.]